MWRERLQSLTELEIETETPREFSLCFGELFLAITTGMAKNNHIKRK